MVTYPTKRRMAAFLLIPGSFTGSCRSISIELTSSFWFDELVPCASIFLERLLWIDGVVVTTSALGPPCPVSSCVDSEDLEEVMLGGCV